MQYHPRNDKIIRAMKERGHCCELIGQIHAQTALPHGKGQRYRLNRILMQFVLLCRDSVLLEVLLADIILLIVYNNSATCFGSSHGPSGIEKHI